MKPIFSVGIVTFNRKELVARALSSVLSQANDDVEIVVVDNHSTDGTAEYIAATFPSVRLIRLPSNVGCPDGRNHVYENCRGELILNLDDDGWLAQGVFPQLSEIFDSDERIGVVALRQGYPDEADAAIVGHAMSTGVQDVTLFQGGVSAFRRSMLDATGGYPRDFFFFAEETYLSLLALHAGFRIVSAPHIVMWHPRVGTNQRSSAGDYQLFRNGMLVVTRLFPLSMLVWYLPLKIGSSLLAAVRRGSVHHYARALAHVLWTLPGTLLTRSPVGADVVRRHLKQSRQWVTVSRDGRLSPAEHRSAATKQLSRSPQTETR
jgi:GT2 family glycosyltransferase